MKKTILIAILLTIQLTTAQNYQTVEEVNNTCSQLGFSGNEDAEIAVDAILDKIGLFRNFTIQECPNINNAVAKIIETAGGVKERYILYDSEFFSKMDDKANNKWAAISILAHEIGHHLNGHALNNTGSNYKFELEADYFSGSALAKMGATLEEAQSAIQTLRYEKATSTHPAKADRLKVIEKGWKKAKGIKTNTTVKEKELEDALYYYKKGEQAFENYNFTDAIRYFNKAKDLGYINANYYLSHMYYAGLGVTIDLKKAYNYAKEGYELGSIPATYQYAKYLVNGTGVAKNKEDADRLFQKNYQIKWFKEQYRKDKTAFHAYAVGYMYNNGMGGVKQDYENALIWYKQAANLGDLVAQTNLGFMYEKGEGVEKDYTKAVYWYRKAAKQGYAPAHNNLGVMYEYGQGVEKDYTKALYWFRKAAEQGDAYAQNNLGVMYDNGEGVEKDYTKAVYWWKKAAKQGEKTAQNNLTNLGETW